MPMNGDKEISLYFHIPFCTKKCPYCHFYVLPDKDIFKKQLIRGLELEWQNWKQVIENKQLVSIYFGGGTPALFGPQSICSILDWVRDSIPYQPGEVEITLEANPENINFELMRAYREIGVNRVSIGIQSLDDELLKKLGRGHTAQKALDSILCTHKAGIHNISVDLMYDLPNQTLETWQTTLDQIRTLPITHLSLYNLVIEPHTVFFKYRKNLLKEIPDDECSLKMYELAVHCLEDSGLHQYEISAFAHPSFFSRHNTGYWKGRSFIGFGPSAFSYWEGKRFRNVAHLNRYCQALEEGLSPIDFEEELSSPAKNRELLTIQLRLIEGVDLISFQQKHGPLEDKTVSTLQKLRQEGFIQHKDNKPAHLSLTKKGILFYDTVASEIV